MGCDDALLAAGTNLAVVGRELIQFGQVTPLGTGQFRLERLLRGRGGTESAAGSHQSGEAFCLITRDSLVPIRLPAWAAGSTVSAQTTDASAALDFTAESLRPPAPVNLIAASQGNGGVALSWTRRSRFGWSWIDEVDAPLGESTEQYRVTITGSAGTVELVANQPNLSLAPSDLAAAGTGAATIEVRQIGDWAASHPAQLATNLD